jgi:SNF2 family DNA or RNA helicase
MRSRLSDISNADLVLTTYALLARDAELLLPVAWQITVLDEVQAIKNANGKTTGLVCYLDARHRLCLTGGRSKTISASSCRNSSF